jgi:hypothetical protein
MFFHGVKVATLNKVHATLSKVHTTLGKVHETLSKGHMTLTTLKCDIYVCNTP